MARKRIKETGLYEMSGMTPEVPVKVMPPMKSPAQKQVKRLMRKAK